MEAFPSVDTWASPVEDITAASGAPGASDTEDTVVAPETHNMAFSCLWLSTSGVPIVVSLTVGVAVLSTSLPRLSCIGITSGDV